MNDVAFPSSYNTFLLLVYVKIVQKQGKKLTISTAKQLTASFWCLNSGISITNAGFCRSADLANRKTSFNTREEGRAGGTQGEPKAFAGLRFAVAGPRRRSGSGRGRAAAPRG